MRTTKAFYTKAPMRFELRDVDVEPLAAEEVRVQIKTCGVCGWDVLVAQTVAVDWMPIGHELSGVVEEVGRACEVSLCQPLQTDRSAQDVAGPKRILRWTGE
jgi:Zn-dependent alcohol dehydrogenase